MNRSRRSSRHRLPPTKLGDPCAECGRTDLPLETDHYRIPFGKGVKQGISMDEIEARENLRWVCFYCNQHKAKNGRESWPDEPILSEPRQAE